jgi:hypothetical protein
MRRPSERFRDRGDPRNPSEPEIPANPFRGAPWPAGSERTPVDPFARLDQHDVPEPPLPEVSGTLGLLPLLGIVLLVAAVSAYVGMTFVGRWTGVVTKSPPAETSIVAMTHPFRPHRRSKSPPRRRRKYRPRPFARTTRRKTVTPVPPMPRHQTATRPRA